MRNYFTFLLYSPPYHYSIEDERTSIGILNAKFIQSITPSNDLVACIPAWSQIARTGPLPITLSPFLPFSLWGYIQGGVVLAVLILAFGPPSPPPPALGRTVLYHPHTDILSVTTRRLPSPSPPPTTRNTYIKSHPSTPTPFPCLFPTPHTLFIEYSTPHLHSHPNQSQTLHAAGILEASPLSLKKTPQSLYLS